MIPPLLMYKKNPQENLRYIKKIAPVNLIMTVLAVVLLSKTYNGIVALFGTVTLIVVWIFDYSATKKAADNSLSDKQLEDAYSRGHAFSLVLKVAGVVFGLVKVTNNIIIYRDFYKYLDFLSV